MICRRNTRRIKLGNISIGGNSRITVQSMTNTDTRNLNATVDQIKRLEEVGCDIIRVAVPDKDAAANLDKIRELISIPLVADIHFDYRLALMALERGIDGIRINPGNIGDRQKIKAIAHEANKRGVAIRIGVNSGSVEKDLLDKFGGPTVDALVESVLRHIKLLEENDFFNIVLSLKSSDVIDTFAAYKQISERVDYPLHVGITESGTIWSGTIKSSIGIGALLLNGIGDTIRVSLTGDPIKEVEVGRQILKSIGMLDEGVEIISCPTCGRCEIDLIDTANQIESRLKHIKKPLKIAVMGCVVNGPGEAREADIGLAGGRGKGIIFKKGEFLKKVSEADMVEQFVYEVHKLLDIESE